AYFPDYRAHLEQAHGGPAPRSGVSRARLRASIAAGREVRPLGRGFIGRRLANFAIRMAELTPRTDTPETVVVHTFTVFRRMSPAILMEQPDWYFGLLQAAAARVRIEGQN